MAESIAEDPKERENKNLIKGKKIDRRKNLNIQAKGESSSNYN
jgi:hypothetical protein